MSDRWRARYAGEESEKEYESVRKSEQEALEEDERRKFKREEGKKREEKGWNSCTH